MASARSLLPLSLALSLCAGVTAMSAHASAPSGLAPAAAAGVASPTATVPWDEAGDADPVFTPDGQTVVFARGSGTTRHLHVSHRHDGHWSKPERAPFSGAWMDFEPAMAPDGSYLIFISNRPTTPDGKPLDGYWGGQSRLGRGGNLWRVDFRGGAWGTPQRLPDIVNVSSATYSPAVAADGSVYFTHPDPQTHRTRLYVSHFSDGRFQPPQPLSFTDGATSDYDPAVAPDQSFLVFSSNRPPTPPNASGLFVAHANADGWSAPVPLGIAGIEPRLAPDLRTLYFSAPDGRIHSLPLDVSRPASQPPDALTDALAPLAWFVGHWHCEGRFANGKPISSRETFGIELGGQWLHMRHVDDPPNRYLADSWWGYDKAAKHFTATVFDNFGGDRRYTSSGWVGDTLTLENIATSGYLDRFAFQRHGDDAYRVTYTYRNRSGAWQLGDEQSCTRDAQAPQA